MGSYSVMTTSKWYLQMNLSAGSLDSSCTEANDEPTSCYAPQTRLDCKIAPKFRVKFRD